MNVVITDTIDTYQDGVLVKSITLCNTRSYSSVSLSFNSSRTPNAASDTLVICSIQMNVDAGNESTINVQVNTGSGFVTIATLDSFVTGAGDNTTTITPVTFVVPANSSYQILSSGTGINAIISTYELTF